MPTVSRPTFEQVVPAAGRQPRKLCCCNALCGAQRFRYTRPRFNAALAPTGTAGSLKAT
ncbi:hypothetical protein BN1263170039 [Stenotrophomonas indicatrix]|nr:hypothetical protein BN1263170039 [Stenotrophomonas indicatrix]